MCELGWRTFVETFVDGFAIGYSAADLVAFRRAAYDPAALADALARPATAAWLYEDARGAEGFCLVGPCGLPHPEAAPDHAELKRLYVRASAQGSGIGRRLMAEVLAWPRAAAGPLWLGVWSGNHRARRFYARYGFEAVGAYGFSVGDTVDDEIIMRRG